MFKIFFFLIGSNDQYWLCVDTQNYKCNLTSPVDNSSGVMSCSISSDDNCQNTKHMCCAITHNNQYWLCVCTHQNCKCNCTTFIADCSKDMMSCSISSDNNCQINKHMYCVITFSDHQWVSQCDMGPLSQICTATKSKHLDHTQVDVTTTPPEWHTIKTSIKTSATISYNPSHLSSLSQATSSIYSSTPPIVDTSSTSIVIVISVTAVLMALVIIILLTSLLLPIIVLRRYGHFKPGR